MELRHLRYFTAVAHTLNFRRAAERVHIEQSPLSQQIRKLEAELGVELFTRNRRRVALTHAGTIFLRDARAILEKADEATERVRGASHGSLGSLSLAYLTSMTGHAFTQFIRRFQQLSPDVTLSFNDMIPGAMLQALAQNTIDVAFLRGVYSTDELIAEDLWQEPLMVAIPKDHSLSKKARLTGADLANESFLMVPDESSLGYNDVVRSFCGEYGFIPKVRAEGNQMQALIWLVHLGVGLALIPTSLKNFRRDNVVYRSLVNAPSVTSTMVYRKDNSSPVVKNFCDMARSSLNLGATRPPGKGRQRSDNGAPRGNTRS